MIRREICFNNEKIRRERVLRSNFYPKLVPAPRVRAAHSSPNCASPTPSLSEHLRPTSLAHNFVGALEGPGASLASYSSVPLFGGIGRFGKRRDSFFRAASVGLLAAHISIVRNTTCSRFLARTPSLMSPLSSSRLCVRFCTPCLCLCAGH